MYISLVGTVLMITILLLLLLLLPLHGVHGAEPPVQVVDLRDDVDGVHLLTGLRHDHEVLDAVLPVPALGCELDAVPGHLPLLSGNVRKQKGTDPVGVIGVPGDRVHFDAAVERDGAAASDGGGAAVIGPLRFLGIALEIFLKSEVLSAKEDRGNLGGGGSSVLW